MTDVFTPQKRSDVMSKIRGTGNRSTELRLVSLFRENGIKGWRRHTKLPGKPDFAFSREKIAVFVDGCFWHGCPKCYRAPEKNAVFWQQKMAENRRRDRRVDRQLRGRGWSVLRVWECSLRKDPDSVARRVIRHLSK